ncbi:MAG TPA: nucleotidyltransferase family protein [Candidatus Nanoarchaeia archaeon]|nr:nucleotidyltransferase family protein [Candidatus Nanoarchaeia archaeon]
MDKRLERTVVQHLKKQGAKSIAVFGSFARDEQKKGSDLDILVEFKEIKSLLEMSRIERELSKKAGIKVDLLTKKGISPLIYSHIKKDLKVIL